MLEELLAEVVARGGSDLFLSVGAPPMIKVEGVVAPRGENLLARVDIDAMIEAIVDDKQRGRFAQSGELNMPLRLGGGERFRVNLFRQQGEPALVARHIKSTVPSIKALGLPSLLHELILEDRGLVLLVGGTGTGKSTTLAAMIDYRARLKTGHILTIEDPIEYVFGHHESLVNQREVGVDTASYAVALKNAMREAPDVIMIGEVRDAETMKQAISYAETGHLCLTTLHASNAVHALDRIKNLFPDSAHRQLRSDLSSHLRAIVSQRLAIGKDGKRVVVVEVMLNTPLIADLILQDRGHEVHDAMIQARALGCQTFEDHLFELVHGGKLEPEEALHHADSKTNLALRFRLEGSGSAPAPRIPREVGYSRAGRFSEYATYRLNFSGRKEGREHLGELIGRGIRLVMGVKGLQESTEDPDLEISYLVAEKRRDLGVQAMENAVKAHTAPMTEADIKGALSVTMTDLKTGEPVWNLVVSSRLFRAMDSKEAVSAAFLDVFSEFPPLQV